MSIKKPPHKLDKNLVKLPPLKTNKNSFEKFKGKKRTKEQNKKRTLQLFQRKSFLKYPYSKFSWGWTTCWQNLHNHYKSYLIASIIKKICSYEDLIINKIYVQLSNKKITVLIGNLGLFTERSAEYKFKKYKQSFQNKKFKKRLVKVSAILLNMINTTKVELKFYNQYIPIKFSINIVAQTFKKEKKERYFKASIQVIYAVFMGIASAQVLGNLIYTYTRRNPKRIRFVSFLKRLINWHFVTTTGFESKISGVRIEIKGRFNAKSRTKKQILSVGRIRIKEGASPVDYKQLVAITKFGSLGIKIWVCPKN